MYDSCMLNLYIKKNTKLPFHLSCIGQFADTITMFITRVTTFCRHAKL